MWPSRLPELNLPHREWRSAHDPELTPSQEGRDARSSPRWPAIRSQRLDLAQLHPELALPVRQAAAPEAHTSMEAATPTSVSSSSRRLLASSASPSSRGRHAGSSRHRSPGEPAQTWSSCCCVSSSSKWLPICHGGELRRTRPTGRATSGGYGRRVRSPGLGEYEANPRRRGGRAEEGDPNWATLMRRSAGGVQGSRRLVW